MRIEYQLTERRKQAKGVFLTFRKVETPDNWFEKLLGRKQRMVFVGVFYPIDDFGLHRTTEMAYTPGGEIVAPHEWNIFQNLLNIKNAENEPPAQVEKVYTREPFRGKEGWINPEKKKESYES